MSKGSGRGEEDQMSEKDFYKGEGAGKGMFSRCGSLCLSCRAEDIRGRERGQRVVMYSVLRC